VFLWRRIKLCIWSLFGHLYKTAPTFRSRYNYARSACRLLIVGLLFHLIFNHEDGSDTLLGHVSGCYKIARCYNPEHFIFTAVRTSSPIQSLRISFSSSSSCLHPQVFPLLHVGTTKPLNVSLSSHRYSSVSSYVFLICDNFRNLFPSNFTSRSFFFSNWEHYFRFPHRPFFKIAYVIVFCYSLINS
jgi:hypothetical protein